MNDPRMHDFLQQVSDAHPCGEDMSYSTLFDDIREARRADDASLAQGAWEADIKQANWPKVRDLCDDALKTKSKDMQLANWYTEALTKLEGFTGLAHGIEVLNGLVTDYWEFCYPAYDPNDLDERAGKIEWLNANLPLSVRSIPLTRPDTGGHAWLKWEESRAVENQGLKDPDAKARAISEGKLSAEAFDKAVANSGRAYYEPLYAQVTQAAAVFKAFEANVDHAFGRDAPGLKDLREAIQDCADLVERIYRKLGGLTEAGPSNETVNQESAMTESAVSVQNLAVVSVGAIRNRADAVRALRDVAKYFRHNEPHSPVSLLAERAAKWAEMPLEHWLATVIKDDGTLAQLKDLLDIQSNQ